MKKIIIFYASYGGGHLSAANAIKQNFDANYKDCEVHLIDCMKYINTGLEKVTTDSYKMIATNLPNLWGGIYKLADKGPVAEISSISNKIMSIKLLNLFKDIKPDIVISTHPFSTQMTAALKKYKKTNCYLASIMTDFAPHSQWLVDHKYIDAIFVSHEGMRKQIIEKGVPAEKIYSTGIPLSIRFLQNFNKEEIKEKLRITPKKKNYSIFWWRRIRNWQR